MVEDIVAHFMPHDEENFVRRQLVDERIPEDDPLRRPKAGDVGVETFRILALVHFVDSSPLDPSAGSEIEDLFLEGFSSEGDRRSRRKRRRR